MAGRKLCFEVANASAARVLAQALQDIDPAPDAVTLFEEPAGWRVEAYLPAEHESTFVRDLARLIPDGVPRFELEDVPELNWVAVSQAALAPVRAGRFVVYGSHDRGRVARGPNTIEIEAGEAFGTAHHATTMGCLMAIDALGRRRSFRRALDLGCGSGVLAIAAARVNRRAAVLATDIDPEAVDVARRNMRINGARRRVTVIVAEGLAHPLLRNGKPFDLVAANILADPLVALVRDLPRRMTHGGALVLSGLLIGQAAAVIAAYRATGFDLIAHRRLHGWSTLELIRRRTRPIVAGAARSL